MKTNLVSIVIPCYNNEKTILETIESAINQTYQYIEIVVVNDGSTDNSDNIIRKIVATNKNVNYIKHENSGPSNSRNKGLLASNGSYLVFVDGDDLIYPEFIEKYVSEFIKNPQTKLVYSKAEYFGDKKGEWILKDYSRKTFIGENCIPIFAMVRREDFIEAGMFDTKLNYLEDWDLWITILKSNDTVYKIPEILYRYRKVKKSGSLTNLNKVTDVQDLSRLYIFNKHYNFFKENDFSISNLMMHNNDAIKYKSKYNNIWYRKIFYTIFKTKR